MTLAPEIPVIVDGILSGEVVRAGHAGLHTVRIVASAMVDGFQPFECQAAWDGSTLSAVDGRPLLVTLEPAE